MRNHQITEVFIDSIRLNFGTIIWTTESKKGTEIVPSVLTHDYLLDNFKIDESIYQYYHLPTCHLLSDVEFQDMVKLGFVGKKETALPPYSVIIDGAYYHRAELVAKLSGIAYGSKTWQHKINGKLVKNFSDLIPYFKEYAEGFKDGFNEFENRKVKPHLTIFAGQTDYVQKVFEYITTNIIFSHGWLSGISGFAINESDEIVNAFENGQEQGYFYRAWSAVFSNNILFSPLFKDNLKTLPSQQTETKTDKLKAELGKYGFFELSKVKQLSEPNKQSLVELISTNDLPYSIAMFEYLGFLKHLKAEHFTADNKIFKAVARWFGTTERAVKGNIYVLNEHSKENRTRYTADQKKQTVQTDYEKLK